MIDALLFAVRDAIRTGGFGYDYASCELTGSDGKPPGRCGDWFVSIHQGASTSDMMNALNEYFDFNVTLTARLSNVPLDRIGDQLLATKLADKTGFNRRINALATFLHMDWGVMQEANNNLQKMMPDVLTVYGFSEPAQFAGAETPILVGSEWFSADPDDVDVGLKSSISFVRCRRGPQAIASYS